ncbi:MULTISPECIES: carboxypeptidase-like regulatory domain-containing protein [Sphingobacterium]|uniref:carboxypeptidase-like regulatory domain-containing protein n=2 Tax=Sphingobacteriaceae TaxID=84566 RepID=UPI00257BF8D6|nr:MULTISPECIES: carboxypeptidase-like regulatory domain-containing protein [Sphingobacterium]
MKKQIENRYRYCNLIWAIKISVFFWIFCFSSCAIIRPKTENNNVLGGYEASSYLDENDSQDSVTISGIVTEAKTKRKVPNAEIQFLDSEGNTLKKTSSDNDGAFHTKLAKLKKFGSIEIDGNSAGFLTIANIDFGIFVNNTKVKARLFKYDYSATEQDFSKKKDRDQLKREIEEMKKRKR